MNCVTLRITGTEPQQFSGLRNFKSAFVRDPATSTIGILLMVKSSMTELVVAPSGCISPADFETRIASDFGRDQDESKCRISIERAHAERAE
jgi:hypothetical protein